MINTLVVKNKTNAAIALGFIDPNGTQFYGYGKVSNSSNATVDQNTIFAIGSITKVFTTTLLADMVNQGLVKLNDPIEKYLPSYIKYLNLKAIKLPLKTWLHIHQDYLISPPTIVYHLILHHQLFSIQSNTERI